MNRLNTLAYTIPVLLILAAGILASCGEKKEHFLQGYLEKSESMLSPSERKGLYSQEYNTYFSAIESLKMDFERKIQEEDFDQNIVSYLDSLGFTSTSEKAIFLSISLQYYMESNELIDRLKFHGRYGAYERYKWLEINKAMIAKTDSICEIGDTLFASIPIQGDHLDSLEFSTHLGRSVYIEQGHDTVILYLKGTLLDKGYFDEDSIFRSYSILVTRLSEPNVLILGNRLSLGDTILFHPIYYGEYFECGCHF